MKRSQKAQKEQRARQEEIQAYTMSRKPGEKYFKESGIKYALSTY